MQQDRHSHSSCILGTKLWVFGGLCGINWLDLVEYYDVVTMMPWQTCKHSILTGRTCASMSALSQTEILIMGGARTNNDLNDAIVFDTSTRKAEIKIES